MGAPLKVKRMSIEKRMKELLDRLQQKGGHRQLFSAKELEDFSSNDYLSLSKIMAKMSSQETFDDAGATGSRLLSGQHPIMETFENHLAEFHEAEAALLFNSGYVANLGLIQTLCRKGDVVLFDESVHASIHDGMRISKAQCIAFAHNDLYALEALLQHHKAAVCFVLCEGVYSMDGSRAPLKKMAELCQQYAAHLIVDEAHSNGMYSDTGKGLCVAEAIQDKVFARVHTFGKAIGMHGAAVLGSALLKDFLINHCRSLIFSTAMPPKLVFELQAAYAYLEEHAAQLNAEMEQKILFFLEEAKKYPKLQLLPSDTAIQAVLIPGNEAVLAKSALLKAHGLDARAIRKPTVRAGSERIRICLHRHNSDASIQLLLKLLAE